MRNPALTAMSQAFEATPRLKAQLGLTPLARKRPAVVPNDGPTLADLPRDEADDNTA